MFSYSATFDKITITSSVKKNNRLLNLWSMSSLIPICLRSHTHSQPACAHSETSLTQQTSKHHDEAGPQVDVDGLDVGDLGQGGVGGGHERGHGQHGGDAEGHPGRSGVSVEPEGHPRDDDNQP